MSYDLNTEAELFNNYIQDCNFFNDFSIEYNFSVIKSKYENGISYFIIKNNSEICQKIYFEYIMNNITNQITVLDEIKIVDKNNCYIETPFNIDNESSYIFLKDIECYFDWFSSIDENILLPFVTPR